MAVAKRARVVRVLAVAAVAALIAGGVALIVLSQHQRTVVTAQFATTVGLYPGSDVRVLGVAVGTVTAVEPRGEYVDVAMSLDSDVDIPAEAGAVVVTPSLVSDRYVQLSPPYTEGPVMEGGAVIPTERTGVPVEVDEVFESVNRLTVALGPDGANSEGALADLLSTSAANLDGTGAKIGEAIRELGKATRTLGDSQDDFFGTIDHLHEFVAMLAVNDDQVRRFDEQLGTLTQFFATERKEFGAALSELGTALGTVERFVRDNRALVKSNVEKLNTTAAVLAKQKASLGEALDRAPVALSDLLRAYDPKAKTLDVRANLNEFSIGSSATTLPGVSRGGGR